MVVNGWKVTIKTYPDEESVFYRLKEENDCSICGRKGVLIVEQHDGDDDIECAACTEFF